MVGEAALRPLPRRYCSKRPILHGQSFNSPEFPGICGYEGQAPRNSLSGNQRVVLADACALTLQLGANLSGGLGILRGIVEYCDISTEEHGQGSGIPRGERAFGHTIPKLMYND